MDLSGIIFVVLAIAWAVYLIPKALKHHDEMARTRSIDRFSNAMRVLAHREPVNGRDTRLVVTPARPGNSRVLLPTRSVVAVAVEVTSPEPTVATQVRRSAAPLAAQRASARAAARRRRHIVLFLLLVLAATGGVAAFGYLPWWSVAVPAGLTVAYLLLCRQQVRRERRTARSAPVDAKADLVIDTVAVESAETPRRAVRVQVPYGMPQGTRVREQLDQVELDQVSAGSDPDEDTIELSVAALAAALTATTVEEAAAAEAVSLPVTSAGSLWDPLPITLPTYVNKPRAARTVRTIDLSAANTWSSGRSEADSKLVEEAETDRVDPATAAEQQRAVGS